LHSLQGLQNRPSNFLKITYCGSAWPGSLVKMIGRVGLAIEMAVLMNTLLTEWLLVLHTERVNWHVVLVAVEHSRLLLGQALIENLLRMVHLLLMMHVDRLLAVVD